MEDSGVENSPPKPHTPQPQQPQLGLGFQSNDPSPLPPNDLDTQNPNKQELQNQQSMSEEQENEYLRAINEEFKNLVLGEKEKENEKGFSESEEESTDREVHGGETVLVMDEREEEDENGMRYRKYHNYPVRPGAEDCSYYMRNGSCKFGANCKFNHPPRRKNQATKEKVKESEENPERPGQTECKYYLRSGGCKYGKACRYNHSRGKTAVAPIAEFNFLGLPIRLGEKECPFYMRNGSCKYGSNCRFNHPDPTAVGGSDIPSGYGNGGSEPLQGASQSTMSSWSSPRALNGAGPFVPVMYPPNQGVPSSNSEWNGYQAPVFPTTESGLPMPPAFALNIPAETNFYANDHKHQMSVDEFPERPGQPECTYFLKTGYCKYRSGCKFHHPKHRMQRPAAFSLSDKGLPLRPDQNICSHYTRYGICKFGPACKFDHPVNYSHSGPSPVPGPDKPSPFGNSAAADGAQMDGWE